MKKQLLPLRTVDITRDERDAAFVATLDVAIKFHRENQNDPHGIGNAVMITLLETRNAFAKTHGLPVAGP